MGCKWTTFGLDIPTDIQILSKDHIVLDADEFVKYFKDKSSYYVYNNYYVYNIFVTARDMMI